MPLDVLSLSSISRLKSPARIIWCLGVGSQGFGFDFGSLLGGVCCWCVGMYIFMMSIGVMSLLLITRAWRYGDIGLGVGILVMLSFVWVDFCIIANLPP